MDRQTLDRMDTPSSSGPVLDRDVSKCFVATEEAKDLAKRMGLSESQIVVHGLPIRPAFSEKMPARKRLRRHLGMDLSKPAVLLVGALCCIPPLDTPQWQCSSRVLLAEVKACLEPPVRNLSLNCQVLSRDMCIAGPLRGRGGNGSSGGHG
jgi:hypothetical protein